MISNYRNLEQFTTKPGSATKPVPGYNIQILSDDGSEAPRGQLG
jgi:propionyl-CoA synthetase